MEVEVKILSAFVDEGRGGNPAGVVLQADGLSSEQKLKVAAQVGLSETAFVSRSELADFKLDFFTPNRQIAHCGHATIATFHYLHETGAVKGKKTSKETIDGLRDIFLEDGMALMEQRAPVYQDATADEGRILASLGLSEADLMAGAPLSVVNTGNSFLLVGVKNRDVLRAIRPDHAAITSVSDQYDLIGYYVFTTDVDAADATARMFGPRYSIPEEAGTGMAAGPLACLLYDYLGVKKEKMTIRQGWYMENPSPSLLTCNLVVEAGKIVQLFVGGKGKLVETRQVRI